MSKQSFRCRNCGGRFTWIPGLLACPHCGATSEQSDRIGNSHSVPSRSHERPNRLYKQGKRHGATIHPSRKTWTTPSPRPTKVVIEEASAPEIRVEGQT